MRVPRRWVGIAAAALALSGPACESLDPALVQAVLARTASPQLDESTIAAGLKEALRVGTRNGVSRTSAVDGFWGDARIRIPLPDELQTVATGLRRVGLRGPVDELELAMNRAAEQACGEVFDVFAQSIRQMSFADARAILSGGDTAATEFFRRTTSAELGRRFTPIVDRSMRQVGLVSVYDRVMQHWRALPLAPQPELDLRAYVTQRGLDGLFFVVGEEEKKIRHDPAARVTELLRRVFGGGG